VAYTRRLGSLFEQAAGLYVIATGETGVTTIVRDIVVWNAQAEPADIHVFISPGGVARIALLDAVALPTNESRHLDLRQELLVGERLELETNSALFSAVVTGYKLVQ